MAASDSRTLPAIGFLTVTHHLDWGLTGGLLVLNAAGRPLEFHCTAPIKTNRAQEILYGPTLQPFLYGEQIGGALIEKVRSPSLFLCTNLWPALWVRHETDSPVLLVNDTPSASSTNDAREPPSASSAASCRLVEFTLGHQPVAVLADYEADRQQVLARWRPEYEQLDLREPFGRIREALDEAQRGATT